MRERERAENDDDGLLAVDVRVLTMNSRSVSQSVVIYRRRDEKEDEKRENTNKKVQMQQERAAIIKNDSAPTPLVRDAHEGKQPRAGI